MSDGKGEMIVVSIASIPLNVSLTARMPGEKGGWLDYSNHEFGVSEIPLTMPLVFELGNGEQETAALKRFRDAVNLLQRATIDAWFDQLDMIHDELEARGGYRAKNKPQKPIEAPSSL
jgi:hypothetical protein